MKKIIATTPAIRFKGFTSLWQPYKFKNITYPSGKRNKDNLPYESFSITNENGFVPQDEKFENGGSMRDADKRMYIIVSPHSFAYNPARINVGSIGYQSTSKDVIVSSLYEVFKTTETIDDHFLWHWFKSDNFQKLIVRFQEGGVRLYFYYDKLCKGTILLPNIKEQSKIRSCLDILDYLITLHQRKLDQLKKLKKYFLQNMFPAKGETVPRIRFKGFTGDWEQQKFENIFTSLQNNTLSKTELSSEDGFALNIHYGDILTKYGEVIDVSKENIPYIINKKIISKFKKSYLKNGDVVIADTAEDETVGKCSEINGITDQIVISGLHTIPLRPTQIFAKGYWGSYLNSGAYHDQLRPLMQGIKVTSISKSALQDTIVAYPLDLKEQEMIGKHFLYMDNLAAFYQHKITQLQTMKKYMLQNMFI